MLFGGGQPVEGSAGKHFDDPVARIPDKETARQQLDAACHKFLSNPIIEDYKLEIE